MKAALNGYAIRHNGLAGITLREIAVSNGTAYIDLEKEMSGLMKDFLDPYIEIVTIRRVNLYRVREPYRCLTPNQFKQMLLRKFGLKEKVAA